jgi:hypothetical protein
VKEIESNCLLDFESGALCAVLSDILHSDIASTPEIAHVLLLGIEQSLEPLGRYAVRCPFSTATEFLGRSRLRRVVDHVFSELDRAVGPSFDCEGDLAKVLRVNDLVSMGTGGFQYSVSRTCQSQAAFSRRVTQHDPTIFRVTAQVMKHSTRKGSRLPRVIAVDGGARFVRYHL